MLTLIRIVFLVACMFFGYYTGFGFLKVYFENAALAGALSGLSLGVIVLLLEVYFRKLTVRSTLAVVLGVIVGLILSKMVVMVLTLTPMEEDTLNKLGIVFALVFSYLCASVMLRGQDEFSVMLPFVKLVTKDTSYQMVLLDTSVIIDGRVADICDTGFLMGRLIVPRFVLKELQLLADSADDLKRNRGRRGLDILNRIKNNENIEVKIHEADFPQLSTVDSKLVKLAQVLNARVFTNDFNLNKIAELQGVSVLNINELANALKPVVMPGEVMQVKILKEGKEADQGVAYLDDGTMVVVDNGRKRIGQTIQVVITSVLQTQAGRMIFAKVSD